jgi:3',5'-cyclic AMP phosphodiesterase CpdA
LLRFLHCSDVHVTADYSTVPWRKLGWRRWIALLELKLGRAEAFAQAQQSLAQIARQAEVEGIDHVIVSGDVTAYSLESEFKGARDALGRLAEQKQLCTVIPGNHDRYTPGSFSTRRFEQYFGQLLESDLPEYCRNGPFPFVRLVGEEAAVIGLCSARVPPLPGLSLGAIGKKQLDGLRQAVRDPRLSRRAVLVAVHHAPLTHSGRKDSLTHGLVDGSALLQAIPGPRFAVLHGHIHRRYYHPPSSTRPHIFGAGSSTQRGSEGYWVIEVSDGKVLGGVQRALKPEVPESSATSLAHDLKVGGA